MLKVIYYYIFLGGYCSFNGILNRWYITAEILMPYSNIVKYGMYGSEIIKIEIINY